MPPPFRIDAKWREQRTLHDGSRVRMRLLRPTDRERLAMAFRRMSPVSRYRRFMTPKGELTDAELRYLTDIDGVDHVAIAAQSCIPGRRGEGIGLARFVRIKGEPDVAEAAVAVTDDWQGRGLGRLLLRRLVTAARERGIRRFRCSVLTENAPMLALLGGVRAVGEAADTGELSFDVPLPEASPPTLLDPSLALDPVRALATAELVLRLTAQGILDLLGIRR